MSKKITIKQIIKLYPELAEDSHAWISGLYQSIVESQLINEFVTKSIASKLVMSQLLSRLKLKSKLSTGKNNTSIIIKINDINTLNLVNKFMDTMGWYPAHLDISGKYEYQKAISVLPELIFYEPKYDIEIDKSTLGKYLYHVTPDIMYNKIKIFGLNPKTKSKISNHPERVYLLKSLNKVDVVIDKLYNYVSTAARQLIKEYFVLRVEVAKMGNMKVFNDPNFHIGDGAVWVFEPIPAYSITIVDKKTVNENASGNALHDGYKYLVNIDETVDMVNKKLKKLNNK